MFLLPYIKDTYSIHLYIIIVKHITIIIETVFIIKFSPLVLNTLSFSDKFNTPRVKINTFLMFLA